MSEMPGLSACTISAIPSSGLSPYLRGWLPNPVMVLNMRGVMRLSLSAGQSLFDVDPGGYSSTYMDHFLGGSGRCFELSVDALLEEDMGVRARVISGLAKAGSAGSGKIDIQQIHFKNQDWRLAIGAFSIHWKKIDRGRVRLSVSDRYDWNPEDIRVTLPIHATGYLLDAIGSAKDFWIRGVTTKPLDYFND